jgi:ATP-dependent helicase/nuclease subunit A
VLDDVEQMAITEAAITATLNAALRESDSALGQALQVATSTAGEGGFRDALREFMKHRRDYDGALETKFAVSPIRQRLGVKLGQSVESTEREILNNGLYSANWEEIANWLAEGGKTDKERSAALKAARKTQGSEDLETYISIFLTDKGTPRASLATKALKEKRPDLETELLDEQTRVFELTMQIKAVAMADRTEAITLLADSVLAHYRAEKRRKGRLDFPDLIGKVVTLLTADTAKWVLFKLDQGLDHVLVDEAQDTSPEQWAIVKAISDDFFVGESAPGLLHRTMFAVGDEKQSIFGFQGAKPEEFDKARRHFKQRIDIYNREVPSLHPFEKVDLQTSYRTVGDVLSMVDQVFSIEENYQGLDSENRKTVHVSNRTGAPGLVELWPPVVGEKPTEKDASEPVDSTPEDAPSARLARRIAARVAFWLRTDQRFEDDGKPIMPGDILVLVRNRKAIFEGVIKALKQAGVPVAGADRMKLNEQIVVLDLLALGRFCLLPEDDLTLAALLKSPLLGLQEDDLLVLANGRGKTSLWEALQNNPEYSKTTAKLSRWRDLASRLDPFAFYAQVLAAEGGRRQLLARLGQDSAEAINVFLYQLRQWQASNPPSLMGFIEAMAANDADVKRDMEEAHGRVRVMTVHASKGLEARIVFLADVFHNPKGGSKSARLVELEPGDINSAVWSPNKDGDPESVSKAKAGLDELNSAESRRLLYVALTRARDRLYIAGAKGSTKAPDGNWHDLIDLALKNDAHLAEVDDEAGEGRVWQWQSVTRRAIPRVDVKLKAAPPALPDWLHSSAPLDLPRPPPLRPSRIADAAEPPPLREALTVKATARLRGDLIHHLLQHLPEVSHERRETVAEQLAAARFPALDTETVTNAVSSTMQMLNDARFADLFTGDARAEVDIAGRVVVDGKSVEVAGRMDRLSITPDRVTLVDFKTGRPPRNPEDVPEHHLQQLAIYDALLRDLYPGREVQSAVIWTALPAIVILHPEKLALAMTNINLP